MQYRGKIGRMFGVAGLGLATLFAGCGDLHHPYEVRTYVDTNGKWGYDHVRIERFDAVEDRRTGVRRRVKIGSSYEALGKEATRAEIEKYATPEKHPIIILNFEERDKKSDNKK